MSIKDQLGNTCRYVVNLHMRSISMPVVSEMVALWNATRVYGQHGICIQMASGQSLLLSAADQLTLDVIDGECQWNQESAEQRRLFGLGGRADSGILVYYVNRIQQTDGSSLNGCAGHIPSRPAVVVAASGSQWTLAHEVGHVLLRPTFSPVHATSPANVMYAPTTSITANPPSFDAAQLTAIRNSPYCIGV